MKKYSVVLMTLFLLFSSPTMNSLAFETNSAEQKEEKELKKQEKVIEKEVKEHEKAEKAVEKEIKKDDKEQGKAEKRP